MLSTIDSLPSRWSLDGLIAIQLIALHIQRPVYFWFSVDYIHITYICVEFTWPNLYRKFIKIKICRVSRYTNKLVVLRLQNFVQKMYYNDLIINNLRKHNIEICHFLPPNTIHISVISMKNNRILWSCGWFIMYQRTNPTVI